MSHDLVIWATTIFIPLPTSNLCSKFQRASHLTSLVAQTVKRLPAMRETQVQSLGREDPLEKEMATHSSPLAWKIPWMEEPGKLRSVVAKSRTRLSDFTFTFHFDALEKEMATHSSVLAWRIPWTRAW